MGSKLCDFTCLTSRDFIQQYITGQPKHRTEIIKITTNQNIICKHITKLKTQIKHTHRPKMEIEIIQALL